MAITQNTFNGDGSNLGPFSFTFKWLEPTDIKVTVSGVLKTAGTHYNLQSLNYATKSGGQVLFTAGNAPAVGTGNIVVYRQTDDSDLSATFNSGSAIRAQDLNDNFIQGLYVTQESSNNAATATSTANTALTNSNTAISTANSAVSTANTASSNASAAVSTANTASSNASAAVSTANTASSNATTAVNTANAATATANSAASDAATAISTANSAVSTANTASTTASAAVSTANTASSNASAAVSTANTASSNASTALSTANTALSTATTADTNATAALNAVAGTVQYVLVANVAAIPGTPANGDAIEIADSTGIESFTPLTNLPAGYVGDPGLSVRLQYLSAGSSWNWLNYFANNAETRYLKLAGGTLTGALGVTTGTAAAPSVFISGDPNTGIYSPGADQVAISTNGTQRLAIDANGNVSLSGPNLSIGGTAPANAGYSNLYANNTSGAQLFLSVNGANSRVFYSTATDLNYYISDASPHIWHTNNTERMRLDSSGRLGIGDSAPESLLHLKGSNATLKIENSVNTGYSGVEFDRAADDTHFAIYAYDSSHPTQANNVQFYGYQAGRLDFYTNSSASPRLSITSAGLVGIGSASPLNKLVVSNGGAEGVEFNVGIGSNILQTLYYNRSGAAFSVNSQSAADHRFEIQGSEKVRIDSSGRLLVGTSSARSNFYNTTAAAGFLLEGTDAQRRAAVVGADFAGSLILGLQKSGAPGGNTIVVNGDGVGEISFQGNDGSEFVACAQIKAEIDNTPGANDMPGRLVFSTTSDGASSPTERLRIDSSGRCGIGTASPGSYSAQLAVSGGRLAVVYTASGIELDPQFGFVAGTVRAYDRITSSYKTLGLTGNAVAFGINDVEKARIDSSGRLLVGTSTSSGYASSRVIITGAGTDPTGAGNLVLQIGQANGSVTADEQIGTITFGDTSGYSYATIVAAADLAAGSDSPGRLSFSTTADGASFSTERMRINNLGETGIASASTGWPLGVYQGGTAGTSNYLITGSYNSSTPLSGGTRSFGVFTNGNVVNTNNSYGAISDIKLKENIVDASSQWDDLKALQVRNYNFKEGQTHTQIGLVAQEAELVSPGLVTESPDRDAEGNDLGTVTKSVNYSVLYMKAVKALQEAMERIETLEAKVAALEAA